MRTIAVLVPRLAGETPPPEARPLGRAALLLAGEGIDVVFAEVARGGRVTGKRARPGHWEPALDVSVDAAYDRFPAETQASAHQAFLAGLDRVRVGNPPALIALCRDKRDCQHWLAAAGIALPELEDDPLAFTTRLAAWGVAFHKPRFGSLGRAVRRVVPGDALPAVLPSALPGQNEPALLQRAVLPPQGYSGVCVRVLVQRDQDEWLAIHPVVRHSDTDAVVNATLGSTVDALVDRFPTAVDAAKHAAIGVAEALARHDPDGDMLLEVGVDLALDASLTPVVIEVNGRPQGRLEVLARQDPEAFQKDHVDACARPLRWLARRRRAT